MNIFFLLYDGFSQRQNELEPVPSYHHWKQDFSIDTPSNVVRIVNQTSDLDKGRQTIPTDLTDDRTIVTQLRNNTIDLGGSEGLNIIALIPKQKATVDCEATISKVLRDRTGKSDETAFKGKKMKRNLKKFRLRVEFFSSDETLVGRSTSETITDTKDKECGALELQNVIRGDTEVCMISEFPLSKDVFPVFKVYERGQHCPEWESLINQPDVAMLTRKGAAIVFKTPAQEPGVINDLKDAGKEIYLLLKRNSDKYESKKMFPFLYDNRNCHCHCHSQVENINQEKPEIPRGLQGAGNKRPLNNGLSAIQLSSERRDTAEDRSRDLHTPQPEECEKMEYEVERKKMKPSRSQRKPSPEEDGKWKVWKINSPNPMLPSPPGPNMSEGDPDINDELMSAVLALNSFQPSQTETEEPGLVLEAEKTAFSAETELEKFIKMYIPPDGDRLEDIFGDLGYEIGGTQPAAVRERRRTVIVGRKDRLADTIQTDSATRQRKITKTLPHSLNVKKTLKVETLQPSEIEEDDEKGSFFLTNFPLVVVALILGMVVVMMVMGLIRDIYDSTIPQIKTSGFLYERENFFQHNLTFNY